MLPLPRDTSPGCTDEPSCAQKKCDIEQHWAIVLLDVYFCLFWLECDAFFRRKARESNPPLLVQENHRSRVARPTGIRLPSEVLVERFAQAQLGQLFLAG